MTNTVSDKHSTTITNPGWVSDWSRRWDEATAVTAACWPPTNCGTKTPTELCVPEKYHFTCSVLDQYAVLISNTPQSKYLAVPWDSQLTRATIANQSCFRFTVLKLCSGVARNVLCGVQDEIIRIRTVVAVRTLLEYYVTVVFFFLPYCLCHRCHCSLCLLHQQRYF